MALALSFGSVWSQAEIKADLEQSAVLSPQLRVLKWARTFLKKRIAFEREASSADFIATLSSVDCITYVYYVLALASATDVSDFERVVARIRFNGDVQLPNLLHFTTNSMARMETEGIVENVTSTIASGELLERRVTLGIRQDGSRFIEAPCGDWNLGASHAIRYIPAEQLDESVTRLRSADIVLFITAKNGLAHPHLVGHAGFAYRIKNIPYLLHASQTLVSTTGRRAGVSILRRWDKTRTLISSDSPLWPLKDYVTENPDLWSGIVVYRCTSRVTSSVSSL